MISVEERERIRRAYFVEKKSLRQIAKELKVARKTVRKAIESAEAGTYVLRVPRAAPRLGAYQARIDELLAQNERLPAKQRYTGHKIYTIIEGEGYSGSESRVRGYIGLQRREKRRPKVYLPLEFDPGMDAQVDWGEAEAIIAGGQLTVQLFLMRLCYSRRAFVMAFPTQKQESFWEGHVQAFHHFAGVPKRISYDNLKVAVQRILAGRNRQEQPSFVAFRSHYLFESRFCTPAQGHEKGGVEHVVGFGRRNFLVPLPQVASFAELNALLRVECLQDDARQVDRQPLTIGQAWEAEKGLLLPRPKRDFPCCVTVPVCLNPYSQVEFETNRYSVPADKAQRNLVLKAYPFQVEVVYLDEVLARHPRSYGRQQDVLDPLHYLPLLEQRPGAFEHAQPLRRWRAGWPAVYEQLLKQLQAEASDGQGIREFVRVLKLHQQYPAPEIEQAVSRALAYGCLHADGVELCLRQARQTEAEIPALDLSRHPGLAAVAERSQAPNVQRYDQLLAGR